MRATRSPDRPSREPSSISSTRSSGGSLFAASGVVLPVDSSLLVSVDLAMAAPFGSPMPAERRRTIVTTHGNRERMRRYSSVFRHLSAQARLTGPHGPVAPPDHHSERAI